MHTLFFEQIIDKPGIKIFIMDISSAVAEYIFKNHDEEVKFDCNHAIDNTGTHYFMHTLNHDENGEMASTVITSISKDELASLKKAMECIAENGNLEISMRTNALAYDTKYAHDDTKYYIQDGVLGLEITDYPKHGGSETVSANCGITTKEDGLSIALDDPEYSYFFHDVPVDRMEEDGDIEIEPVELAGKVKSFYEKMELEREVSNNDSYIMSL